MLFYPAALPLSSQTLNYAAGVIRRHRRQIGSCWRKLSPGQQALLVLAYLRKGETFAELAAGFGVGTATAWRYVSETTALLAARSPKLRRALADAKKAGHAYVVIDGTLIPVDRVAADRPFYSGKHRRHGMNLQVISTPDGEILWVSGPLPGAVHDLTAAPADRLCQVNGVTFCLCCLLPSRAEAAVEGDVEGVEGGLPPVGPPLASPAGGVQAHDRHVQALECGVLGGEMAAGVHGPP